MKIICTQENLKTGISAVNRIITSSNTLPILNNLLLQTENGLLKISSTNLEISIHTLVRCKVEEAGQVCVPAKIFSDLVSTLPNKNIMLTSDDKTVRVDAEKNIVNIKVLPSEDFPSIPVVESAESFTFDSRAIAECMEDVVFAASNNETQPEICGVLLRIDKEGCTFVATDRYRLSEKKLAVAETLNPRSVILPLKTAYEVIKSLSGSAQTVEMAFDDNQMLFVVGDTHIISRLIDGQYPDYEQIIPTEFKTTVVVNRMEFLSALKTSSIFSQGSNSVRFSVSGEASGVVVSSDSQDLGESVVSVKSVITGPDAAVLFNHRYILDMLNAVTADNVVVKINSDSLPVVFSEENKTDYLYLVMPIKN